MPCLTVPLPPGRREYTDIGYRPAALSFFGTEWTSHGSGMFWLYLLSMASACTFLRLHVVPGHTAQAVPALRQSSTVCVEWSSWHMASLLTMCYMQAHAGPF